MDITKRQNLLVLWKESFAVVNRAAFKLIGAVVVLGVLAAGVIFGVAVLGKSLMASGGMMGAVALGVLGGLLMMFFGFYLTVCFWRILGYTAENALISLSEVLSSSFMPTLYCIMGQILWMIVAVPVTFAVNYISSPWLKLLVQLALSLAVFVRIVYAFPSIALKGQGPIDGFVYSWRLTGKNYVDTLLMCFMNALFPLLIVLFLGACAYGLYVGIPLFFADSFDILHPTWHWFAVGGVVACCVLFIATAMFAFPIVVFVNRDYCDDKFGEDIVLKQNAELRPLTPEAHFTTVAPQPLKIDKAPSADLGPASVKLSRLEEHPQPRPEPEVEEGLDLLKASFRTEQKPQQVQQQLKQVYQPKSEEGVIEYSEEDRMPTIVFDEQMTRQLEENRKFWQNDTKETTPDSSSDETGPIRMSK